MNPGWGVRTPADELPVPVSVQKAALLLPASQNVQECQKKRNKGNGVL